MKRGDVVTVSLAGDYGKPRPAVIVQSDLIAGFASVLLCPITSVDPDTPDGVVRLRLRPTPENGLRRPSDVMVEKLSAAPRQRLGEVIGRLSPSELTALERRLAFVIGLGD